ncbi:MAG: HmuY family protein [Sediminibacterium sp.]
MKIQVSMLAAVGLFFSACNKTDVVPVVVPVITSTQSLTVNFSNTKSFAFFSFKDSAIVANSDSATTKWDIGLRYTNFIVNSNASGPGNAGVSMQDGIYSSLNTAPAAGYAVDTTSSNLAIKDGSWYDYNPTTHAFVPKAGKVFFFRTADGAHFVKMQLLSVDYLPFVGQVPLQLVYKFQYSYQPNGTKNF